MANGRSLLRSCGGAVYIEFLIVVLPLVAITFGLAQSALIYLGSSAVERAAGVGARAAIVVLDDDPERYGGVSRGSATGARLSAIEEAASFPLMPFEDSGDGTIASSLSSAAFQRLAGIGSIFGGFISQMMSSSFSLSSLMPNMPSMPGLGSMAGLSGLTGGLSGLTGGLSGLTGGLGIPTSIPGVQVPGIPMPGLSTGIPGVGNIGGGTLGGFQTPTINLPNLPSMPQVPSIPGFEAPNFGGGGAGGSGGGSGSIRVTVDGGGGRGSPVTVTVEHLFRCRVPIARRFMCNGGYIRLSASSTLPNMAAKYSYGKWN